MANLARKLERELAEKTNEVARLREELQEIKDGMKFIMDEKCAESEVHCGCVPLLKVMLKKSEAENQKLREAAQTVIDRWETPLWKDAEPTAAVIYRLREALNTADK